MDTRWWPRLGGPTSGAGTPPVDYLEWYIPHLMERRPHDLSQSGHFWDWPWEEILADVPMSQVYGHDWISRRDPAELVAEREGLDPAQVALCAGTTQGLHLALLAMLPDPNAAGDPARARRVAVEMPSYAPVSQTPRLLGCEVLPFSRLPQDPAGVRPWLLDRASVLEVLPQVSTLILTPMHNPSGWMMTEDDQQWLADQCGESGVAVISDEAYLDAARGMPEFRPYHTYGDHCVSVTSLTKVYGLGGLRFGWCVGTTEVVHRIQRLKMSTIGMLALPSLVAGELCWPHLDAALKALRARRAANLPVLESMLAEVGVAWGVPQHGIFGVIRLPGEVDAGEMLEKVGKRHGLLASPGNMFDERLRGWLRIAWGGEPEVFAAAAAVLGEVLRELQAAVAA